MSISVVVQIKHEILFAIRLQVTIFAVLAIFVSESQNEKNIKIALR